MDETKVELTPERIAEQGLPHEMRKGGPAKRWAALGVVTACFDRSAEQVVVVLVERGSKTVGLSQLRRAHLQMSLPIEVNRSKQRLTLVNGSHRCRTCTRSGDDVQFRPEQLGGEIKRRVAGHFHAFVYSRFVQEVNRCLAIGCLVRIG